MRALLLLAGLLLPFCYAQATTVNYNATCYTVPNDSYDNLIDSWVERNQNNPSLDRDYFERQFARDDFDKMRENINCRWLVYQQGPYQVGGFMLKPADSDQTGLPVIIYNRPGQGATGAVSFRQLATELAPLVHAGFVVIGSQYLGGGGVFPGQRNGDDEFGGADVDSVLALLDIIAADNQADASRVGLYGKARGSMMNFLAARQSNQFRAIASVSTLADLEAWLEAQPTSERIPRRYIPDYPGNRNHALTQRSVINWLDEINDVPVLMIHGGQNRQIPVEQSQALAEALEARDHDHELIIYDRGTQDLRPFNSHIQQEVITWFEEHL